MYQLFVLSFLVATTAAFLELPVSRNETQISWRFRAYEDENCQTEIIVEDGQEEKLCADTSKQLHSYRFSADIDPDTLDTFSVRLYDQPECLYLSVIDDPNDGACHTAPFQSYNVFSYAG